MAGRPGARPDPGHSRGDDGDDSTVSEIVRVTSEFTWPSWMVLTTPRRTLRALVFMWDPGTLGGGWHHWIAATVYRQIASVGRRPCRGVPLAQTGLKAWSLAVEVGLPALVIVSRCKSIDTTIRTMRAPR